MLKFNFGYDLIKIITNNGAFVNGFYLFFDFYCYCFKPYYGSLKKLIKDFI